MSRDIQTAYHSVKQKTSWNLWPKINSLNPLIKPRKARFQKIAPSLKFVNMILAARRREHVRFFLAIFLVAELPRKKKCLNTQEFTRFLSTGVVTASSHAV